MLPEAKKYRKILRFWASEAQKTSVCTVFFFSRSVKKHGNTTYVTIFRAHKNATIRCVAMQEQEEQEEQKEQEEQEQQEQQEQKQVQEQEQEQQTTTTTTTTTTTITTTNSTKMRQKNVLQAAV